MLLWHTEPAFLSLHHELFKSGNRKTVTSYEFPLEKQERRKGWGWLHSRRAHWWSSYQSMDKVPRWRQVFWLTEPGKAAMKFPPQNWLRRLRPGYREILQGQTTWQHDFLPSLEVPSGGSWKHSGMPCILVCPHCGVRTQPRLQSWALLPLA